MSVKTITPAEAIRAIDAGTAIVLDVRQPEEHELQRIPGSLLLPLDTITAESAARVLPDKHALIYVHCRSGVRSAAAAQKLEALCYTNLRDLGGLMGWPYELE
ncbi:MAG: rhodanese-like domain-containing protein [Oscillospiraceae bacterium]|nr:rhodanese-like domain-containing protein [Oscillospiraceae bacterium]